MTLKTVVAPVNVLLVEDDDGDAKAVERAFKKAKINNPLIRARDGVEGLEYLLGQKGKEKLRCPYILLVDLNMPRMDGIELVTAIRENDKIKHSVIFILTTSKSDEDKLAAYDLNVTGYIVKSNAGQDFMNLVQMIDNYWNVVELPDLDQG